MFYDLYYFVENCLFPQAEQFVGEYIISSAPPFDEATYTQYINRYIYQNRVLPNVRYQPTAAMQEDYRKMHPVTLIRRLNYSAENEQEAIDKTKEDLRILCCLLSLERGCAAQFFGILVVNNGDGSMNWTFYHEAYKGNLLPPFEAISSVLQNYLIACQKNPEFILHTTLHREAKDEGVWDLQYFRYWNLLEVISMYVSGEKSAERRVTKMFEEIYRAANTSLDFGDVNVLEEIPIWHQHRNCVAHHGACQRNNPSVCKKDRRFLDCKDKVDKAEAENSDQSLWVLAHCTTDILKFRMIETSRLAGPD